MAQAQSTPVDSPRSATRATAHVLQPLPTFDRERTPSGVRIVAGHGLGTGERSRTMYRIGGKYMVLVTLRRATHTWRLLAWEFGSWPTRTVHELVSMDRHTVMAHAMYWAAR